ncbi:MAG: peptide chain release factor N(5)-glutamine methyltransferase [Ruminococcaceae bacterium]|nr:peptide chain release factor N(5)-glutamine methyltransferase [Oscillospiraceae bacterium]
MVIGELLQNATGQLQNAGIDNARLDAEVLLAHLLNRERLYLVTHRTDEIAADIADAFRHLIVRRVKHEPVAYLIGQREFMSLDFSVCPGVLIPRPDTETLVELILETTPKQEPFTLLDLCTGSGAIAVSLAHYLPNSHVTAVDISDICVETAKKNATRNGVAGRVQVLQADILKPLPSLDLFDCVVSNPPYIPTKVLETLEADVQDFEPHTALDGGGDGLIFYRHIIQNAPAFLRKGGLLALEIGHDQRDAVTHLMAESGFFTQVDIRRDLAGIDRVVFGRFKG